MSDALYCFRSWMVPKSPVNWGRRRGKFAECNFIGKTDSFSLGLFVFICKIEYLYTFD